MCCALVAPYVPQLDWDPCAGSLGTVEIFLTEYPPAVGEGLHPPSHLTFSLTKSPVSVLSTY